MDIGQERSAGLVYRQTVRHCRGLLGAPRAGRIVGTLDAGRRRTRAAGALHATHVARGQSCGALNCIRGRGEPIDIVGRLGTRGRQQTGNTMSPRRLAGACRLGAAVPANASDQGDSFNSPGSTKTHRCSSSAFVLVCKGGEQAKLTQANSNGSNKGHHSTFKQRLPEMTLTGAAAALGGDRAGRRALRRVRVNHNKRTTIVQVGIWC